jgi:hypothetical protein
LAGRRLTRHDDDGRPPLQVTPRYRRDDGFTMNRVLDRASALDVVDAAGKGLRSGTIV